MKTLRYKGTRRLITLNYSSFLHIQERKAERLVGGERSKKDPRQTGKPNSPLVPIKRKKILFNQELSVFLFIS